MVLVTGGTGLVGAHLLVRLTAEDGSVRAIHREDSSLENVRHIFSYYYSDSEANSLFARIEWVQADINDIMALEAAFRGVTHVYHCAAFISFHPGDFQRLRKVNAEGTANIVNLCITNRIVKLCFVSSIATIGRSSDNSPATEEDFGPDRFPNVYALSKQSAELEVWRGTQEGVRAVIVNPGIILGPGFWKSASGSVFGIGDRGLPFAPPGVAALVSVADVVDIMVGLMASGIENERFIAVAENWPYKKLLQSICDGLKRRAPGFVLPLWALKALRRADWLRSFLWGGKRRLTRSSVESLEHPVIYDNQKITQALNFEFEPVAETIAACCRFYKQEHP